MRRMVKKPTRPSVAMKAKASGTPAKFEATPENVINVGRNHPGSPPRNTAQREKEAEQRAEERGRGADLDAEPIGRADRRLVQPRDIVEREASRHGSGRRRPAAKQVGAIRNISAKTKNGVTPSQAERLEARRARAAIIVSGAHGFDRFAIPRIETLEGIVRRSVDALTSRS